MTKQDFPEVDSEDVAWDAQLESWRDILRTKPFPLVASATVAALPAANANDDGLIVVTADNGATGTGKILALSNSPTSNVWKKIGTQAAAITSLVDNSGGVAADGTIAAVTTVAQAADAIKELATKVNEILTKQRASSLIDD